MTSLQEEMRYPPLIFGNGEQVSRSQPCFRVATCRFVTFIYDLWAMSERNWTSRIVPVAKNIYAHRRHWDISYPHEVTFVQTRIQTPDSLAMVLDTPQMIVYPVDVTYHSPSSRLGIAGSRASVPIAFSNFFETFKAAELIIFISPANCTHIVSKSLLQRPNGYEFSVLWFVMSTCFQNCYLWTTKRRRSPFARRARDTRVSPRLITKKTGNRERR